MMNSKRSTLGTLLHWKLPRSWHSQAGKGVAREGLGMMCTWPRAKDKRSKLATALGQLCVQGPVVGQHTLGAVGSGQGNLKPGRAPRTTRSVGKAGKKAAVCCKKTLSQAPDLPYLMVATAIAAGGSTVRQLDMSAQSCYLRGVSRVSWR